MTEVSSTDMQQGADVAQAGVEAAQAAPTAAEAKPAAKRAIRRRAEQYKLEMSEEDAAMIASAIVDQMEARGAFDQPPEPVAAAHPPAVEHAGAPAPQQEPPAPPRKQSFAERFRTRG